MSHILAILYISLLSIMTDVAQATTRVSPKGMTLHKASLTWEDAQLACQREGNILASPINEKALSGIQTLMGSKNTTYYIGIKSNYYTGPFVSVEGLPLDLMPLATQDMIDSLDQLDGDCLAMNRDSIYAVQCWSRLPYICYNAIIYNMTLKCGSVEGYQHDESMQKCYKVHDEELNWAQAEQTCIAEGGHLVVVDNAIEAQYVKNMVKLWMWCGLQDATGKGDWTSVYQQKVEELYHEWFNGKKPAMPDYKCGAFSSLQKLGWYDCKDKKPFICEKNPSA